jgi:hypothetical protein
MEDDTGIDLQDDGDTELSELDDEILAAAKPKGSGQIVDGTSNT